MKELEFRYFDGEQMVYSKDCNGLEHFFAMAADYGGGEKPVMQFTGLKDKNGVNIYQDDLLNICFTSSDGEYIHDSIYRANIGALGDVNFDFIDLLWIDSGKNQYPSSTTLCQRYSSLDYEYKDQQIALKVPDSWKENHFHGKKWKGNDKSFYFEVIGNVHQNPELLEKKNG